LQKRILSRVGNAKRQGSQSPLMVNSVEKAFQVLTAFDAAHPNLSLTQLCAVTGLPKSAAQRFAHTLTTLGYLDKDPDSKRFALSIKILGLGYSYMRTNNIIEQAAPYMADLSKRTGETVSLTVRDDTEIIFVSRLLSQHVLNVDVIVGTRLPAYCTAPGIAILSRLPRAEARKIIERSDLRAFTPSTTFQAERLFEKIDQTRVRGYATAFEEYYHGDLSVAAAVVNSRDEPICAINIAVSRARFTPAKAESQFAPLVVAAASAISHKAP